MFTKAIKTLCSKPAEGGVALSAANAGARFVNLMQLRDGGGMATVFTANQLVGGPESSSTRRIVLKRSDKDQPAAHKRESRVLQYLSRPGATTEGFVMKLLEAYSTPEHNFIAMERGGENLTTKVEESKSLALSERKAKLTMWGQQACQVGLCAPSPALSYVHTYVSDTQETNNRPPPPKRTTHTVRYEATIPCFVSLDAFCVGLTSGIGGSARHWGCVGGRETGQFRLSRGQAGRGGLWLVLRRGRNHGAAGAWSRCGHFLHSAAE